MKVYDKHARKLHVQAQVVNGAMKRQNPRRCGSMTAPRMRGAGTERGPKCVLKCCSCRRASSKSANLDACAAPLVNGGKGNPRPLTSSGNIESALAPCAEIQHSCVYFAALTCVFQQFYRFPVDFYELFEPVGWVQRSARRASDSRQTAPGFESRSSQQFSGN